MKLIRAKYSNLFSLGQDVEIDLNNRGLVLVTGRSEDEKGANGSGKSSLTSKGIIWVLYGTTTSGIKADNVINRHGKKKASGEVEFSSYSGEKYLIRRERPAKLSLFKNGKDISSKTAADTQKEIDRAIGMNFATFIQTAFFGQGRAMSYASLTPKDQKALLEQILPIEEIDGWAKYADSKIKELTKERDSFHLREAEAYGTLRAVKGQLESAKTASKKWVSDHETKIENLKLNRANVLSRLQDKKGEIKLLKEQREAIDTTELSNQLTMAEALKTGSESSYMAALSKKQEAQRSNDLWKAEQHRLKAEISRLESSTTCPTCERSFGTEQEDLVRTKVAELEKELKLADQSVKKSAAAVEHYNDELATCNVGITQGTDTITRIEAELAQYNSLKAQIDRLEREVTDAVDPIDRKIESAEQEQNPHLGYEVTIQAEIDRATEEYNLVADQVGKANCELEHLTYWRDVYAKEIKLKLFEECCGYLDDRTEFHLRGLHNSQFHVEFSTIKRLSNGKTKDEFGVNVWSESGGGNFDSLSGGEQQMVSFAIGLALADLASIKSAVRPEFLILDEPFSELDDRNSEAIVEYLSGDLIKETVLLVSNEDALKGLIPERIHVVKKNGVTNVEC